MPVRLKQYFSHTKEVPEKPPFTDDVSILKRWDNCNVEQKVAPLIPPRAVYCIQYFLEGGCGGVPRGRGEGGNLLRTLVFKLRYSRTILFLLTINIQRDTDLWRLLQKECLLQRWPACGNRQTTKRSATAKQMHAATGLTVLALLPVPLALCPRASFLVYANSV